MPVKPFAGVYVKLPSAFSVTAPLAGVVFPEIVAELTMSFPSPPGAPMANGVLRTASYESSNATGGLTTVNVTVAVEFPATFDNTYLNVSVPVKSETGGAYVNEPSALSVTLPPGEV